MCGVIFLQVMMKIYQYLENFYNYEICFKYNKNMYEGVGEIVLWVRMCNVQDVFD